MTIQDINNLKNDDGFTIKKGKKIRYKTGWQVALSGITRTTAKAVLNFISNNQNCGVWYSDGIYYLDTCKRISTKKEAVKLGKENNQQSIYNWKNGKLAWL